MVPKRKKQMLHVPLAFKNCLTKDALVDSDVSVSSIIQNELDRVRQQAPAIFFKIDDPVNSQIQTASGQLDKPIAEATLFFSDFGDDTSAEHFIVIKNLTGPIVGLHFMRHNSLVIDTTHGLIHFPHSILELKSAASGTSAKPGVVLIHDTITVPTMTRKTIAAFVGHPSEQAL